MAMGQSLGTFIPSPQVSSANFIPLAPCRIADTRTPNAPLGGPAIAGNTFRDFVIPNSACGIPSIAAGYSLNVAVVPRGTLGFLTLWPSGQPRPLVATLNSIDGRIKSNAAIVRAGANGAVSVFATDTTDVILDINGYFVAGNDSALAFYPLTPCRVADTRGPTGPLGGPSLAGPGPVDSDELPRSFPILASSCGLPANAQAYSLNLAAVPKGPSLGFLTAWPTGQPMPLASSLNDPTGTVLANAAIVPAGTGGAVSVFVSDATDLVIDINGYFAPPGPGGLSFYTVTPCRVLDLRLPAGSPSFSSIRDVDVTASPCGVPPTAQAFVLNATAVPPGFLGYITMWPQGQTQPLAATLNAYDGAVTSNMAIVPTTTGSITIFPSAPTQLVLDIFGYFAPPISSSTVVSGVVNAASKLEGAIAPGELVVVTGSGLGPAQVVSAAPDSDGLYPAQLAGTTVLVNGTPAALISTSATQVAAVVPDSVSGGSAQVTVTYQAQTSASFPVPVAPAAPGIFTVGSTGQGHAVTINQDGSINTPAEWRDIITLFATGTGQATTGVTIHGFNLPVNPISVGKGTFPGVTEIKVPIGGQLCDIPVLVQVGNATSQPGVTIAIDMCF